MGWWIIPPPHLLVGLYLGAGEEHARLATIKQVENYQRDDDVNYPVDNNFAARE